MDQEEIMNKNKRMSDEERLKLATKLDKELDDFINSLEKKQYTEGWPEDRWQEEMEKHPFFMTKPPDPGDELHPLLEGIQQLKYDPEENTAEELAVSYKEDGNFNFKYKKYRLAIFSYTEGIKQKHDNVNLLATLYNNRAASHFYLKNFRSCIRDCESALKLKPNYTKALNRVANCYFELEKWDKCIEYCDEILTINNDDLTVQKLRQNAILSQKTAERNLRRKQKLKNDQKNADERLINEIHKRGITLSSDNLHPVLSGEKDAKVYLDSDEQLIWPVGLAYPNEGKVDFIYKFAEHNTFVEELENVLREPAPWDPEFRYKINTINLYFEESRNGKTKIHKVKLSDTLNQTISKKEYMIKDGMPLFLMLEKNSPAEKNFLKQYT